MALFLLATAAAGVTDGPSPHEYFDALVARPDHWVSASLRDQAWLDAHYKGDTSVVGKWITYDPANDADPDRQDAAKVTLPPDKNSIPGQSQVYVPLGTEDGRRYLFTWDAYWTPGMLKANHNIQNQKTWQFSLQRTSFTFWLETKIGFSCNTSGGPVPPGCDPTVDIGALYVRSYNADWDGQTTRWTPEVHNMLGPSTAGWSNQPLGPMRASFRLKPRVWTRFWWLFEQRANDWDRAWLWVADEQEGPVLIVDGAQVSLPTTTNSIGSWFLEYNTSSNYDGVRTEPLVSYVRNFVALRDPPADVTPLLVRPIAGAPLPPPPRPPTGLRLLVKE
jgi:hypothetical protein